jgi:hypothetical protein
MTTPPRSLSLAAARYAIQLDPLPATAAPSSGLGKRRGCRRHVCNVEILDVEEKY